MKEIRVGATLAAEYLGMSMRGFYNLVERDAVRSTRDRRTGHRVFDLVELGRVKAERATWPKRGRPRVQFTDRLMTEVAGQ